MKKSKVLRGINSLIVMFILAIVFMTSCLQKSPLADFSPDTKNKQMAIFVKGMGFVRYDSISIQKDTTKQLTARILKTGAKAIIYGGNKERWKAEDTVKLDNVKWKSSDESVLKIDDGLLKPVKARAEPVLISAELNGNICYIKVTVTEKAIPVQKVIIIGAEQTARKDASVNMVMANNAVSALFYEVVPKNATDKVVAWHSSHPDVVSIDPQSGKLTAKQITTAENTSGKGYVEITATAIADGVVSKTYTIKVEKIVPIKKIEMSGKYADGTKIEAKKLNGSDKIWLEKDKFITIVGIPKSKDGGFPTYDKIEWTTSDVAVKIEPDPAQPGKCKITMTGKPADHPVIITATIKGEEKPFKQTFKIAYHEPCNVSLSKGADVVNKNTTLETLENYPVTVDVKLKDGNGDKLKSSTDTFTVSSSDRNVATVEIIKDPLTGLPAHIKVIGKNAGVATITLEQKNSYGEIVDTKTFKINTKTAAGFSANVTGLELKDKDGKALTNKTFELQLEQGITNSYHFEPKIKPDNANPAVTWSIVNNDDKAFAKIDENTGIITVKKNANRDIEIKATSVSKDTISNTAILRLKEASPASFNLSDNGEELDSNTKIEVTKGSSPEIIDFKLSDNSGNSIDNSSFEIFEVNSSDEDKATVEFVDDSEGNHIGVKVTPGSEPGESNITITQKDAAGNVVGTKVFKVVTKTEDGFTAYVSGLKIQDKDKEDTDQIDLQITQGGSNTYTAYAKIEPAGANPAVTWSFASAPTNYSLNADKTELLNSANEKVASIDAETGLFTVHKNIDETISIKAKSKEKDTVSDTIDFNLEPAQPSDVELSHKGDTSLSNTINIVQGSAALVNIKLTENGKILTHTFDEFQVVSSNQLEATAELNPSTGLPTDIKITGVAPQANNVTITLQRKNSRGDWENVKSFKVNIEDASGYSGTPASVSIQNEDGRDVPADGIEINLGDGKYTHDFDATVASSGANTANPAVKWSFVEPAPATYSLNGDKTELLNSANERVATIDAETGLVTVEQNISLDVKIKASAKNTPTVNKEATIKLKKADPVTMTLKKTDGTSVNSDTKIGLQKGGNPSTVNLELGSETKNTFEVSADPSDIVNVEIIKDANGIPTGIKTSPGTKAGTATVTITQKDGNGNTTTKTFKVENRTKSGFLAEVDNVKILDENRDELDSTLTMNLDDGMTHLLHSKVGPDEANPSVKWSFSTVPSGYSVENNATEIRDSSNVLIATIDPETGLITVKKDVAINGIGIKLTSTEDTDKSKTINLNIEKTSPAVITLTKDGAELDSDDIVKVQKGHADAIVNMSLSKDTNNTFEVSISPANIATVSIIKDSNNVPTGIKIQSGSKIGSATVTVIQKDSNGDEVGRKTFKVENRTELGYLANVESVKVLDESGNDISSSGLNMDLGNGMTHHLSAKIGPDEANQEVKWSIVNNDDKAYAEIDADTGILTVKKNATRDIEIMARSVGKNASGAKVSKEVTVKLTQAVIALESVEFTTNRQYITQKNGTAKFIATVHPNADKITTGPLTYEWKCEAVDGFTTKGVISENSNEADFSLENSDDAYNVLNPQAFLITVKVTDKNGKSVESKGLIKLVGEGLDAYLPVKGTDLETVMEGNESIGDYGYKAVPVSKEGILPPTNLNYMASNLGNRPEFDGVFLAGRKVKLSRFSIGKTEVTNKLWKHVLDNAGGFTFSKGSSDADNTEPVVNISWFDAIVFCNAYTSITPGLGEDQEVYTLNGSVCKNVNELDKTSDINLHLERDGFRLPTEAEWEYAARFQGTEKPDFNFPIYDKDNVEYYFNRLDAVSGSKKSIHYIIRDYPENRKYSWAREEQYTSIFEGVAGHSNSNLFRPSALSEVVENVEANRLGLWHMSGNAREWCFDKHYSDAKNNDSSYLDSDGWVKDPYGSDAGEYRVTKGGAYDSTMWTGSVGHRAESKNPDFKNGSTGLRLVITPRSRAIPLVPLR